MTYAVRKTNIRRNIAANIRQKVQIHRTSDFYSCTVTTVLVHLYRYNCPRGKTMTSAIRRARNEFLANNDPFCFLCGAGPLRSRALNMHLLVPATNGGTATRGNVKPACTKCHESIGGLTMREYYDKRMAEMKLELDNIRRAGGA